MISTLVNYEGYTDDTLPKGKPCILVDTETNDILYPISAGEIVSGSLTPPPDDNGIIHTDKLIQIPINVTNIYIPTGYKFERLKDDIILSPGVWIVTANVHRIGSVGINGPSYLSILGASYKTNPTILRDLMYAGQYWCLTSLVSSDKELAVWVGVSTEAANVSFGQATGEFIAVKLA